MQWSYAGMYFMLKRRYWKMNCIVYWTELWAYRWWLCCLMGWCKGEVAAVAAWCSPQSSAPVATQLCHGQHQHTAARVITTVCWLDGWSWPICDSGDLHRSVTTPVQWWTRRYESVFNLQITALTWRIMFLFYVCVQNRRTLGWDIFVVDA